jgi:hypothetical protein
MTGAACSRDKRRDIHLPDMRLPDIHQKEKSC